MFVCLSFSVTHCDQRNVDILIKWTFNSCGNVDPYVLKCIDRGACFCSSSIPVTERRKVA